jgi:hypothetical protein
MFSIGIHIWTLESLRVIKRLVTTKLSLRAEHEQ